MKEFLKFIDERAIEIIFLLQMIIGLQNAIILLFIEIAIDIFNSLMHIDLDFFKFFLKKFQF